MNKIKQLMEQYGLTEHQVTRFTGQPTRTNSLRTVARGEREVTSLNLNLLTSFARGLGLRLEDLVDDFDLDGTSTQVKSIKRYVKSIEDKADNVQKGKKGYIAKANVNFDKNDYQYKENYNFLNPSLSHAQQQVNEIYLLNNSYLNTLWNKEKDRNRTLAKLTSGFSKKCKTFVIYSEFKLGGDLTMVASVYNRKNEFLFSELIGCEWIDKEDNQSICYYKARSVKNPITPQEVSTIEKKEISELEFYKGLSTQLKHFNIVEQ